MRGAKAARPLGRGARPNPQRDESVKKNNPLRHVVDAASQERTPKMAEFGDTKGVFIGFASICIWEPNPPTLKQALFAVCWKCHSEAEELLMLWSPEMPVSNLYQQMSPHLLSIQRLLAKEPILNLGLVWSECKYGANWALTVLFLYFKTHLQREIAFTVGH